MVKKYLKDYEIESCERMGDSTTDIIVVFKNAAGRTLVANGYMCNLIAVLVPLLFNRCVATNYC